MNTLLKIDVLPRLHNGRGNWHTRMAREIDFIVGKDRHAFLHLLMRLLTRRLRRAAGAHRHA